jgi:signal peptide peptidase SppA
MTNKQTMKKSKMKTRHEMPETVNADDIREAGEYLAKHPGQLKRVVSALVAQPWAIKPDMLDLMIEIAEEHSAGIRREFPKREQAGNGLEVIDGVAYVTVEGVLMNRANAFQRISGATSPQEIARQVEDAMTNPDVVAVVLHTNSPGGQVAGVAEAADRIWEIKQGNPRPIVAFGEGLVASGAYWIASQADQIYVTPTTMIGSIGVVTKIVDSTRAEKNAGYDSYVIKTGAKKAVGVGPITEDQVADLKAITDEYFGMFLDAVKRGRARELTPEITSGKLFTARQALAGGVLVDGIRSLESIHQSLKKSVDN